MNATMVSSGTKAIPPVVSSVQYIPLAKIRESKTNPRRFFDEAKLAELADFVPRNKIRVMWLNPVCGGRTRSLCVGEWRLRRTFVLPYAVVWP